MGKEKKRGPGIGYFAVWVAALCALLAAPARGANLSTAPILAVEDLGKGTAALDGPWQFHLGDDATWASPTVDDVTGHGGWEQITADQPWGAQGHPSYTGYAWYRKHLYLTPAQGTSPEFAMLVERIEDVYELYWNGRLIARHGEMPPHASYRYSEGQPTFGLGEVRDGVLAVRVWKAPLESFDTGLQGGFHAAPIVGSPTAIAARRAELGYRWLRSRQYQFGELLFTALVAVLGFLVWLRNREQRVLFWVSVFCGSWVIGVVLTGLRLPFSHDFALGWLQPILGLRDVSLLFLLLGLFKLNDRKELVRWTQIISVINLTSCSLDGLLTAADWSRPWVAHWAPVIDGVLTAIFTAVEAYPLVLVAFGLRQRLDSARWLVAIFAFLSQMIFVTRIALSQGSRFTHWTVGEKINAPLFTIHGNSFNAYGIAHTLLLVSIAYAVYQYSREAIGRQQAIEQELRSAQELQQVLIPEELPALPGFSITSSYRPAQQVGGDFFQIIPLEDASTLIVVGDVSGKGLRAAMAVSLIVGAVRSLAEATPTPAAILAGLNRRLHGRLHGGFATCIVMRLDANGGCTIANAGHPAPYLNGSEVEFAGTLPLGIDPAATYTEKAVQFHPADYMVLYTDGLYEARTTKGELFSFERMSSLLAARPNATSATDAAVGFGQQDDITVLTLTKLGVGEEARTELTAPVLATAQA